MAEKGTKEKLDIELEAPADFTSPEELYQDLINTIRKYHPSDDITMIEKAYRIADEAHKEQKRKSGEPYIIHPLCVAIVLADLEMDKETIISENVTKTKREIEDTIDTINQAFENLLNSFFEEKALDVSSDISVLHTMLAQEGLTGRDFEGLTGKGGKS